MTSDLGQTASGHGPTSYDVRIWNILSYRGVKRTTYVVRWTVSGEQFRRTFGTRKLADSFRTDLATATKEGKPFELASGLPQQLKHERRPVSWLEFAMAFAKSKWPEASPSHRRGIAETLTDVTIELTGQLTSMPLPTADDLTLDRQPKSSRTEHLRRALYRHAFTIHPLPPQSYEQRLLTWAIKHSMPITGLTEPSVLRRINARFGTLLDGKPASPSTFARKRAIFHGALEYGVEERVLDTNPLDAVRLSRPKTKEVVDRGVVANADQADALLAQVRSIRPELEAFFACIYYAGLRPAEAKNLSEHDLTLPARGWGQILLSGSQQSSHVRWTDDGNPRQQRQLKHRAVHETRRVPAHPNLVAILRHHIATYPPGAEGRLFVARTGRGGVVLAPPHRDLIGHNTIYRAWDAARRAALPLAQYQSPLARRPYDLRHACLSTWLNGGVPPTQVAEWAGHSVQVLLRIYAKCIDGQEVIAMEIIERAVPPKPQPPRHE